MGVLTACLTATPLPRAPLPAASGYCGNEGPRANAGIQARMLMPRGDAPEDCGIDSLEVKRRNPKARAQLFRSALSMADDGIPEAHDCVQTGSAVARNGCAGCHASSTGSSKWNVSRLPQQAQRVFSLLRGGPKLSAEAVQLIDAVFKQMDTDGSADITRAEAERFFGGGFAKMSANAMFSEVDDDQDSTLSGQEFQRFWQQVRASGYSDDDIIQELTSLMEGGAWVDFDDKKSTVRRGSTLSAKKLSSANSTAQAWDVAKLPRFAVSIVERLRARSRLSPEVVELVHAIFNEMDKDGSLEVTRDEASKFFGAGFGSMSAKMMFDECDINSDAAISVEEFLAFWGQVRRSGYSDEDLVEELRELLARGAWVDFHARGSTVKRGGTLSAKGLSKPEQTRKRRR